ncbi:hypothetical protein TNCV_3744221 [Trichonephila clavipes]|nr:hypothetical protein TNCV_3744221 [Trichonephila clavipes]
MESGEDLISSSINHIKNLTSLTSSKIQRIKWAGHVVRMDEDRTIKNVFQCPTNWPMSKGRPNLRWILRPRKYLLVLRTKNWRTPEEEGFLRRPRHSLGCRATEEGRKNLFYKHTTPTKYGNYMVRSHSNPRVDLEYDVNKKSFHNKSTSHGFDNHTINSKTKLELQECFLQIMFY